MRQPRSRYHQSARRSAAAPLPGRGTRGSHVWRTLGAEPLRQSHGRPPDIRRLLELFEEHGVRYVVTGSAAAMLHDLGAPAVRSTTSA
jgi:hypothetical protein